MGAVARNGKYVLVSLLLAGVLCALPPISRHALAFGFVSVGQKPALISSSTTGTFSFNGFGSFECQVDSDAFAPCTSPYTTATLGAGLHTFTVHVIGETDPGTTVAYTWTINTLPSFTGDTTTGSVVNTAVDVPYLQLVDADSSDLLTVKLTVPSGVLAMSVTNGLTFTGSQTGTTVIFTGTSTNINSALASLVYTPNSSGPKLIQATLTGASGSNYETLDGHVYAFTTGTTDWATAKAAAEASTFGGVSGYLANVTSSTEYSFLQARLNTGSWLGGSDAALEGDWRWISGPEAGTAFWNGDVNGVAAPGAFTNWQAGQPDNYGGVENCLEMRYVSAGAQSWNDENCSSLRGSIIEYGSGATLPALDTGQISVTVLSEGDADGDGIPNSAEVVGPSKGDANDSGSPDHGEPNVGSQRSSLTGKYVVVDSTCAAHTDTQISSESATQNDAAFDYPHGLVGFIGTGCGAPGVTVTVHHYFYGNTIDPANFVLRKRNSSGSYTTVAGAVFSAVTIGGQPALKVTYTVVDGGPLDADGVADGTINDPAGPAVLAATAPSTGLAGVSLLPAYALLATAAGALAAAGKLRRQFRL